MSHSQTLNKLLDAGINIKDFQISAKDLDQQFGQIGNILFNLGWFTQDYATCYQCSQCGAVHEVVAFNGKYFIGCDVDGDSGLEALSKDDLLIYRFSTSKFYSWLQSQFSLQGNIKASDGKVALGQGMVNDNKRLFIFSHDSSSQSREKLYQDHPANQVVIVYLSLTLDSHKGYDINLTEYLVVQDNSLSIDVSSSLSVIEDTAQAKSGGQFAFELVQGTDMVMMTGSILGGQSIPLFGSRKSSFYRILSTLLKVHEQYAPEVQRLHSLDSVTSQHPARKIDELEKYNLVQNRQILSSPGKELMSLLLSRDYQSGKTVFTFRRAITQADYDELTPATKAKISSALSNSSELVKG
ncbi:MAG: hypothetical protein ABI425_04450 [Patescibacteria group bacterium]